MGKKRQRHLEHYVREGRCEKSTKTAEELCCLKKNKGLKHFEINCIDEAELRNQFKGQGVSHKFFMKKDYFMKYMVAECGTPVAQIFRKVKLTVTRPF